MSGDDKLGFKVTLKPESRFANVSGPSNRTGFIGLVYEVEDFGPADLWYRVVWETGESNSYKEEDLLWYDYVDDWKDVVRSWGGIVVEYKGAKYGFTHADMPFQSGIGYTHSLALLKRYLKVITIRIRVG